MKQRDVIWIRVPYADGRREKFRPALVLSPETYNRQNPDVIVCAITSNLRPQPHKLPIADEDVEDGHLPLRSMVRADKIVALEKDRADRPLARLTPAAYDRVVDRVLGLIRRAN